MTSLHAVSWRTCRSVFAATALGSMVLLAGCGKEEKKAAARPPVEVTTLTIAPQDVPISSVYVAQTQSSQAVTIAARVAGFLDKRVYVEGSTVKAGQVMFRMDQKPFQAQVDAAAAALQRNQAALEVAKANLARTKPLAQQNALSQKDLDDAQGQYEQSAAAVAQSKAQLEAAQLDLSYTTITSPVDGVSSFAAVADGSYVNAQNSQLTTVSVLTPMWINFSLSENDIERIRTEVTKGLLMLPEGNQFTVEIELVDGSLYPYKGRITFADPSFNSQTGTFLIRASVDNPKGVLRPNQFVRTRLRGAIRPHAILVPQRAVQQGAKGHFVWVVNKAGQSELRPVVVGDWHGDDWFISQGLAAGDRVVVDGALRLAPDTPVKATPFVAKATTSASAPMAPPRAGELGASAPAKASAAAVSAQTSATSPPPRPASGAAAAGAAARTAVHFEQGSAALGPDQREIVALGAAAWKDAAGTFVVRGYVDRSGSRAANVDLAKRRAMAVRDALEAAGIPAARIRLEPPADVVGSGSDADARRVEITLGK